jgi:dihydrofolate reductase
MAHFPRFHLILAMDARTCIGYRNRLPWPHMKTDMAFFRHMTHKYNNVLMGSGTFRSMGSKPLNGRNNYVLSPQLFNDYMNHELYGISKYRQDEYKTSPDRVMISNNVIRANNILIIKDICDALPCRVWVIGGKEVYNYILANYITHVDTVFQTMIPSYHECDKYLMEMPREEYDFPMKEQFNIVNTQTKDGLTFRYFQNYDVAYHDSQIREDVDELERHYHEFFHHKSK